MFRLGHKIYHGGKRLGQKAVSAGKALGTKAYENVEKISGVAGTIENVAGKISGGLGTAASVAALTGFGAPVAAGLASAGAAAGAVAKGAGMVQDRTQQAAELKAKVEKGRAAYDTAMKFMG